MWSRPRRTTRQLDLKSDNRTRWFSHSRRQFRRCHGVFQIIASGKRGRACKDMAQLGTVVCRDDRSLGERAHWRIPAAPTRGPVPPSSAIQTPSSLSECALGRRYAHRVGCLPAGVPQRLAAKRQHDHHGDGLLLHGWPLEFWSTTGHIGFRAWWTILSHRSTR
jgi:hypothetical protein